MQQGAFARYFAIGVIALSVSWETMQIAFNYLQIIDGGFHNAFVFGRSHDGHSQV